MFLLIIYAIFLLFLGYYEYRKKQNIDGFMIANRQNSAFSVGMSIIASSVGGSATMGIVSLSQTKGFAAIWWLLSGAIGLVLMRAFLSFRVRLSNALTMPELMQMLIGKNVRLVASIIIIIAWSSIVGAQFVAVAKIFQAIWDIPTFFALTISACIVIIYSALGGQASIIKSDIYQFGIMIGAFLVVLFWLGFENFDYLSKVKVEFLNDNFKLYDLSYYLLVLGGGYVVCPMLFARLLSAKDEKNANLGVVFGIFGIIICAFVIIYVGLGVGNLLQNAHGDIGLISKNLFDKMPSWLGILLLFGLFSAVISSADSCLITASTIFCHDVIKSKNVSTFRIFTAIFGVLALIIGYYGKSILGLLLAANDVYTSGIVAPVFVAILAYKKFHISQNIMLLAIIIGGLCGLNAALGEEKIWSFIGFFLSAFFAILSLYKGKIIKTNR